MSELYGPGTYFIQLNASGKPSLYTWNMVPIDDPQFQTAGNASLFFQSLDGSLIAFEKEPITWYDPADPAGSAIPEPTGNGHHVAENVEVLILNVTPPVGQQEVLTFHFMLHLNVGGIPDVLWTHDGSRPLDPTIVENPPNG